MKKNIVNILICLVSLSLIVTLVVLIGRKPATAPEPTSTQTQTQPTVPLDREGKTVGICLPSQAEEWTDAALFLKSQLEQASYQVVLAYGNGNPEGQLDAMNALKQQAADCLVVAPVDSAATTDTQVPELPILSYGSLLMGTEQVAGYICYDYFGMGAAIARQIESALRLDTAADENRSYTTELFMGASRDYNALLLHKGLRSVLDDYLASGVLVCKSGRLDFEDCSIAGWSAEAAAKACQTRLENHYPDSAPNICINASDAIATGVISALEAFGVSQDHWPLITGNGATADGLANMDSGKQFLTVSTDPKDPASTCVAMVDMVLFGATPDFLLDSTFNHVVDVPTALCDFKLICE